MTTRLAISLTLLLFFATGSAQAQDEPAVGLVMGYPASVGVIWHPAEKVAIRPAISLDWQSSRFAETSDSDASRVGAGVDVLLYVARRDGLRLYLSPQYGYDRSTVNATVTITSGFGSNLSTRTFDSSATTTTHRVGGAFGAQYVLGGRFAVQAETGLQYRRGEGSSGDAFSTAAPSTTRSEARNVGIRSVAGVVLYF